MNGKQALVHFAANLTDYEKNEIQHYKVVFFVGKQQAQKINASSMKPNNFGYDDERGDYNIVM